MPELRRCERLRGYHDAEPRQRFAEGVGTAVPADAVLDVGNEEAAARKGTEMDDRRPRCPSRSKLLVQIASF